MNIILDILRFVLVTLLMVIGNFMIGLWEPRLSAKIRRNKNSCMLNFARCVAIILLQVMYHYAVDLGRFFFVARILLHAMIFFFMYCGSKFCVIGLTGGISCGKSTLSGILKTFNQFNIVDADKINHELMANNVELKKEVCAAFGAENVLTEDGKQIDRAKLGKIIFADPAKRK